MMDEQRIEQVLRAGPPDEPPYRPGGFARALAARTEAERPARSFRVAFRADASSAFVALALVVAVVALVAGLTSSFGRGPAATPAGSPLPSISASPSASPSGSPSPSAAATGVGAPAALVDRWVGSITEGPDGSSSASRPVLDISGAELRVDAGTGGSSDRFDSAIARSGPDALHLTAVNGNGGCQPFDAGEYRWSLSPGGTSLTLVALSDACQARSSTLSGTWTHTACRDVRQDCLGPIEAGTYTSTAFDATGTGDAGQLIYTVPDGWANTGDVPIAYSLRPATDYANDPGSDGGDTASGIYLWAGTLAAAQPADCAGVAAPGVEASASAIATYLASLPGLVVVDGGTIDIDGREGRVLDLAIDPSYTGTCPWSAGAPFRSLITFADGGPDRGVWGIDASERLRVILVDDAPGRVVSVWVDGPAGRFDELVTSAMPIIETFQLGRTATAP